MVDALVAHCIITIVDKLLRTHSTQEMTTTCVGDTFLLSIHICRGLHSHVARCARHHSKESFHVRLMQRTRTSNKARITQKTCSSTVMNGPPIILQGGNVFVSISPLLCTWVSGPSSRTSLGCRIACSSVHHKQPPMSTHCQAPEMWNQSSAQSLLDLPHRSTTLPIHQSSCV